MEATSLPGWLGRLNFPAELPITPRIDEIVEGIARHQVLIVAGETGSGKTTQLPKACLAAGLGTRRAIAHTQPRRLAARTVAARVAEELGVELGAQVGYAVRFSERVSNDTRIKVMTDGLLLNEIQRDRRLERYECIIVDEAHERSLNIDFILGYLRRLLDTRRDLKVIVTSATIDVDAFAAHFNDAAVVEVSGRGFPVETVYRDVEETRVPLVDCLRTIAEQAPAGDLDVLVFQAGEREIFDTSQLLKKEFKDRFEIMPLYARLPVKEQQRIFKPGRRQRIVLATNVAETSITVPNIGYVVDPGLARISRYSFRAKLQRLPVEPISQASARQRAGRCGRVAPGVCYRLYSQHDFESRPAYTDPELTRTNLAAVVLAMRAFRLGDIESFPFIDPPDPRSVRDAVGLLHELQALDGDALTSTGRTMARLPVDPRLARMLIEASGKGGARGSCLAEALIIISALAAQDPRLRPIDRQQAADQAHAAFAHKASDFMAYVNLWHWLEEERGNCTRAKFHGLLERRFLSPARVREWRSLHRQLLLACRGLGMQVNGKPADYATVHRSLLAGSLGFVGQKREPDMPAEQARSGKGSRRRSTEYDGARGLRFHLFPGSVLSRRSPQWVVASEISVTGRTFARVVARVEPGWIEDAAPHLAKHSFSDPYWDERRGEGMVRERVTVYGLTVVGQRPRRASRVDRQAARSIFVHEGLVKGDRRLEGTFIAHNEDLVRRIEARQAKGRRVGLLVSESARADFYLDRLPADVCSIATFNDYVNGAPASALAGLRMAETDIVAGVDSGVDENDFPGHLELAAFELPLAYKFAPGEPDDGVTVRIDDAILEQLHPDVLDWLVPGFFEEKCLALARALPKPLRRRLTPVRDRIREILPTLLDASVYRRGNLAKALSRAVREQHGVDVPVGDWRQDALAAYLCMNVQVRDRRQRVVDQDRDLGALRSRCRALVERDLTGDLRTAHERLGITVFPEQGVPDSVTIDDGQNRVVAYPVLVDRGDAADLRLQSGPSGRRALNRDAYTRLAMLADSATTHKLRREVERDRSLGLHFAPLGRVPRLADAVVARAYWFACFDGFELPRSRQVFNERLALGRRAVTPLFFGTLEEVRNILMRRTEVASRIETLTSPGFAASRDDLRQQLADLVSTEFLVNTPRGRLGDLSRYLDAMAYRIAGLQGRLRRDMAGMEAVGAWQQRLATLRAGGLDPDVGMELWFLVQEFRVATFCQQLGTREKVSAKRLKLRFDAAG